MTRENPLQSLHGAAAAFKLRGGHTLVEIGGMRHGATNSSLEQDGGSTAFWAQHSGAAAVHTVDISPAANSLAIRLAAAHACVFPVLMDGVQFLRDFNQPIDLLYLDAWDVSPDPRYQECHLHAFLAAVPRLHQRSLVLIDDTDFPDKGKGRLVIPAAVGLGFHVWWSGRQTMLGRGL